MPFSRAKVGQDFVPSAEEHNAFIEVALHHRNRQRSAIPGNARLAHPERLTCQAKNNTGAALAAFSTAVITGMAITPETTAAGLVRGIDSLVLSGGPTTADDGEQRPIVFLSPVASGKTAPACVGGITPARVNVSDSWHTFAVFDDDERLKSTHSESGVRLLWTPGVGDDQLCMVTVGLTGPDSRLFRFTLKSAWSTDGNEFTCADADIFPMMNGTVDWSAKVYDRQGIFSAGDNALGIDDVGLCLKQDGYYHAIQAACPSS